MSTVKRHRRLRTTETLRKMVRETRISANSLIYPIFVCDGNNVKEEIESMPNQYRWSIDRLGEKLNELTDCGISKILIFGIPAYKDEVGSSAWSDEGIVQRCLKYIKVSFPKIYCITDVCMCEYTSHGHCGIVCGEYVDNDKSLEVIAKTALSHAKAGADMVAPSDMMDGRVGRIREELDKNGFINIPIMAYSAKYSSAFYGPFREAADSAPAFGSRKTYQMDFYNIKEALSEVEEDIAEGADIVMVKPGMAYLDVVREVKNNFNTPLAVYSVSGEYSMIKAAAKLGCIDEEAVMTESAVCIFRAGADILITYFAPELGKLIREGKL